MTRKLLPYEYQLIETLGVTKEEYLDFLSVQFDYSRTPEQKLETPQADPLTASIIITVVGILFQVASILLMPKPDIRNQNRPRDARFAPRFGFNSSQELAQYGEPVNLIYCNNNQNSKGAVRASMALVWSTVEDYGSSQFMQLLLVLGAASVKRLDFAKVAFGQLAVADFGSANAWLYYNENGRVTFNDLKFGDVGYRDPSRKAAAPEDDVCRLLAGAQRLEGYSQAFSPSSKTSLGVYSPIPINVNVIERGTSGAVQKANNLIYIDGNNYRGNQGEWKVDDEFTLVLTKTQTVPKKGARIAVEAANDMRYQYANSLDLGSVYTLGTARFKLAAISGDQDLDNTDIRATFRCIEAGRHPRAPYDEVQPATESDQTLTTLQTALDELTNPSQGTDLAVSGPITSVRYSIPARYHSQLNEALPDININYSDVVFNFSGSETVTWRDALDRSHQAIVSRDGSLAYTKAQLENFIANKPKLTVKQLRREYQSDLTKAKQLRNKVLAGKFDGKLRQISAQFNQEIATIDVEITLLEDKIDDIPANSRANKKKITEFRKEIERLRKRQQSLFTANAAEIREAYVDFVYAAREPFVGVDNNRYVAGVELMEARLNEADGESVTDQIGTETVVAEYQALITEKENAIAVLSYSTSNWSELQTDPDDAFFNKCLVKSDNAAYQTVTACDFVKFSMKCRIFRRVSGRARKYGEKDAPDGYKIADNGLKGRLAFFKVLYRKSDASAFQSFPIVFAVRRATDQDNFIGLSFKGAATSRWHFKLEPIADIIAEVTQSGQRAFGFIENAGEQSSFSHTGNTLSWTGSLTPFTAGTVKDALAERGPAGTNEWDLFSVRSDTEVQFSFDNGPEFSIGAITEQQIGDLAGKYDEMSMVAFGVYSGRGVQDLRSVTAYVNEGKACWRWDAATQSAVLTTNSTSYAPDIFADTVLDRENGIGKYAKPEGIDWVALERAKRFCQNNGLGTQLFMDCVIADNTPWRQFWAEVAPYSLLELGKIGGKETLIPAIPTNNAGIANREVQVSALFTQGNILEGTYKEEFLDYGTAVQDLIATVIYRETDEQDLFPRNVSVDVRLKTTSDTDAIRQTFDLSQYVTRREQAILYGKLLCNQRHWIKRGIEFQTFPTDSPISPGAYIYVDVGLTTWDQITSGAVMDGGALNTPLAQQPVNGSYSVLLYKPGQTPTSLDDINVSNGTASALAPYAGQLFVLGAKADRKRVFRVTEVRMDQEGEVTVKAMEHPCETVGNNLLSLVAQFSDNASGMHPGFVVS